MLARCATVIARPWWEWYLKVGAISGSVIIFIAASLVLYFDAKGVISNTVLATVRVLPRGTSADSMHDEREQTQRLDLKAVYDKVENRFRRNQVECQNKSHIISACTSQSAKAGQNKFVEVSNLRNRKGKKPSNDLNISSPACPNSNKLTDKINHNNGTLHRSNNSNIQIGGAVDEVAATYMNLNIKKEKENIGNLPSNIIGKKKKGNIPPQQNPSNNGKVKKGHNKIENFAAVVQHQKKTEEETSSTTTESSNPDEIVSETDRKNKNKISNLSNQTKTRKTNQREKKQQQDSSSSENISNFSESFSDRTHDVKKIYTKKKELSTGYGSVAAENMSKPELWDTPRPPSGEGLSELAAQTEAFVLQRPKKRTVSGDGQAHGDVNFNNINTSRNPLATFQMSQQHQVPSYASIQQRGKKPGVIGQPRSAQSNQGTFGSHPHSISPSNTSFNHPPGYIYSAPYPQAAGPRQHLAPSSGISFLLKQLSIREIIYNSHSILLQVQFGRMKTSSMAVVTCGVGEDWILFQHHLLITFSTAHLMHLLYLPMLDLVVRKRHTDMAAILPLEFFLRITVVLLTTVIHLLLVGCRKEEIIFRLTPSMAHP